MANIVYQIDRFWVTPAAKGYEVYEDTGVESKRCAVIGFDGREGLARAIREADRRAALKK